MRKLSLLAALLLCPSMALLARADDAKKEAAAAPPAATQPSVADLSQQRIEAAEKAMKLAGEMQRAGLGSSEELSLWSQRWLQARLDAAHSGAESIEVLREYVELTKSHERDAEARMKAGVTPLLDAHAARYFRIDAEVRLANRLARADGPKGEDKPATGDTQRIQGTWKVVKKIKNGDADLKDKSGLLNFAGRSVTLSEGGEKKGEGTFSIDESTSPKRITLAGLSGQNAGKTFEAIYELNGDSLKLAYGIGENTATPPKDFAGGEGEAAEVLERQKP